MKKYKSFFIIRFSGGLQYRAAAYAGIATQYAWGFLTLIMFHAFYGHNAAAFPMPFEALSSYLWMQQAFLSLFMAWYFDNEIFDMITNGNIAYELCRPADLYTMWFVKNMAVRLSKAVLRCLPILIIAIFLPPPFSLSPPASLPMGAMFLLSLLLGFLVMVSFSMLIYISSFYTISPLGIRILTTSMIEFFSGALIPLPFLPDQLRFALGFLPFASIQNTPFLIYTGYMKQAEIPGNILLQCFWLLFLIMTGRRLMKHALKRVVVQGG